MTRDQAKEILIHCRLNTADQTDPEFLEALQLAASDPELNQWLNQQQEFHLQTREQFREIKIPAGLKEQILAAKPVIETIKPIWRRAEVWAIAAMLAVAIPAALFIGSAFFVEGHALIFEKFEQRMTSFALKTYQMDIRTNNATVVRQYLASKGAPADFPVPPNLERLPVKGGGKLTWQNRPVSMMCFDLPDNETAFLFIIDKHQVNGALPPEQALIRPGSRLTTARWTKGNRIYLLAASKTPETVGMLAEDRN